jgi:hypothetical protein
MSGAYQRLAPRFECGECSEVHDLEWDAEQCCPVRVREVYECPQCRGPHPNECAAFECCGTDPDEQFVIRLTAAELEAAGQLRLAGL